MPLTKADKQKIVADALRDHLPWEERDEGGELTTDTRTLSQLRKAFESRHLGGLVRSYRSNQAQQMIEAFDIEDI
ncbi:hypothetical protein LCGC14_1367990 [marine sediment metagenome]|uniref:Uncharacterized protein n=1 Tax=marine sediment metagenome TaxID=412755 RepID=A0A0F9N861_9ZZZZ